jgi:hypothetical protein
MFKFSSCSEGLRIVREADQVSIPVDPEDQDYCDFLTWASAQDDPGLNAEFGFWGRARFFADAGRLMGYFKGSGDILFVEEISRPEGRHRELPLGRWQELGGEKGRFCNLCKAVALPSGRSQASLDGIIPKQSKTWITGRLRDELNALLPDEEAEIRRLSTWPIERCFVYIDVSEFSQYPPGQQGLIINSLVRTVQSLRDWDHEAIHRAMSDIEAMICIGDGYIYAFKSPKSASIFAACLAYLIEILVARRSLPVGYHFRMSVHVGPVYSFWDPGRQGWNYIGDGINGGQRVLSAIGKDVDDILFISSQIKQCLTAEDEGSDIDMMLLNCLQNKGRRTDKHGNAWRVYEVNHNRAMSSFFSGFVKAMRLPGL